MTKEELAAKIVALIRADAPDMNWPDVDTAVLMAAHEIRIGHHSAPPVAAPVDPTQLPPPPEAGGNMRAASARREHMTKERETKHERDEQSD